MVVENWVAHKLSELFRHRKPLVSCQENSASGLPPSHDHIIQSELKAQGQWFSAISSLEKILNATFNYSSLDESISYGLILSGPTPVLSDPKLISRFQTGIFTPKTCRQNALMPSLSAWESKSPESKPSREFFELPLYPQDPLTKEQFCLVLTAHFNLLMILGEDEQGLSYFDFSFDPEIIEQGWLALRSRLLLSKNPHLKRLEALAQYFRPSVPDYKLVMDFSRQILQDLPLARSPGKINSNHNCDQENKNKSVDKLEKSAADRDKFREVNHSHDIELLQALSHEIRTPLTTIRTMTKLLLKRAKLTPQMSKCLEVIDQECTEQINRMELIFRAAEWGSRKHQEKAVQLVPISLEQVLQNSIPRWQKQAKRRNIDLDVIIPQILPQVVSDPAMLEQMLSGLVEKCTRTVPQGGQIKVKVTTAGHQLKLQFHSQSNYQNSPFKALGQLLMFQPATGSLSLNLDVTKNLFHALGGKLTVRQRPENGEVLTIFLPLGSSLR